MHSDSESEDNNNQSEKPLTVEIITSKKPFQFNPAETSPAIQTGRLTARSDVSQNRPATAGSRVNKSKLAIDTIDAIISDLESLDIPAKERNMYLRPVSTENNLANPSSMKALILSADNEIEREE